MLAIKIDPLIESRLRDAAARLGQQPDALATKALQSYLEDLEDYASAVEALRDYDPAQSISLRQMKDELGLGD